MFRNLVSFAITGFVFLALYLNVAGAASKKRKGSVHEHGKAKLNIAVQDSKARIELKIPMESLVGFEKKPKTEKEKATYENAMTKLSTEISRIAHFDDQLSCDIKKEMVERTEDSTQGGGAEHSDVNVDYTVSCQRNIEGTSIVIDFSKSFKRVKKAEISVLWGAMQKSAEYAGKPVTMELK